MRFREITVLDKFLLTESVLLAFVLSYDRVKPDYYVIFGNTHPLIFLNNLWS